MTVRGLVVIVIGLISFVIVDSVITNVITGTDTGSTLITTLLRLVTAAVILVSAVMTLGRQR